MDEQRSVEERTPGVMQDVNSGHPKGLWVLFITEMWERFSYYGMRALLVLFLIASTSEELASGAPNKNPGFGWTEEAAAFLYAFYVWAVYLTPIAGGWLADKFLGTNRSMLIGGWIIAAGHIVLALTYFFEPSPGQIVTMQANPGALLSFVAGLVLIIIGTGFFKPCVSVMVGQLYGKDDPRRDSGFTIFYMGINLGAFLSPLVAGYLGEKIGWHWGFGSAAVGMIAGIFTYQYLRPKFLHGIGLPPHHKPEHEEGHEPTAADIQQAKDDEYEATRKFTRVDFQRLAVICVLAFVGNIFFWAAFEQAGTSMNVFALKDTDRTLYGTLEGGWKDTQTDVRYGDDGVASDENAAFQSHEFGWLDPSSGIIYTSEGGTGRLEDPDGVIVRRENAWYDTAGQVEYPDCGFEEEEPDADAPEEEAEEDGSGFMGFLSFYFGSGGDQQVEDKADDGFALERVEGGWKDEDADLTYRDSGLITIPLEDADAGEVEEDDGSKRELRFQRDGGSFPASFYQSVNALTIVLCAPFFSLLWVWLAKRKKNPSTPLKFSIGLWLLGLSFIAMVFGAMEAKSSADGQAGPHWLFITYVVYTWGELCLSPVGLSMVTKLAPKRLQSFMMGVWFFSFSLANLLGGLIAALSTQFKPTVAAYCVEIAPKIQIPGIEGLAGFYALLVALPIGAGVFILLISPILKKMMHGIK